MTDLITDLREWAHGRSLYTAPVLARKAADRIEALEAALACAAHWINLAKQPGDVGTDWLNEGGWDDLDDVAVVVTDALSPSGGEAA